MALSMTTRACIAAVAITLTSAQDLPGLPTGVKEPSPYDEQVSTAQELLSALASGTDPISLQLVGSTISLGGYVGPGGLGSAPGELGVAGRSVTLWSSVGTALDAEGLGRVLHVDNGTKMLLQGVTLTGGVAPIEQNPMGGGCVFMGAAAPYLMMRGGSRLSDCSVACPTCGRGAGGGILKVGGELVLSEVVIEDCHVSNGASVTGNAVAGGGVMVLGGDTMFVDVNFTNTSAVALTNPPFSGGDSPSASERWAFGGGVGVACDCLVRLRRVSFEAARATSHYSRAWGGAIGVWSNTQASALLPTPPAGASVLSTVGSRTLVYDSSFVDCRAEALMVNSRRTGSAQAFGGGIGLKGGTLEVHTSSFTGGGATGIDATFGGAVGAWAIDAADGATAISVFRSTIVGVSATSVSGAVAGAAVGAQAIRSVLPASSSTVLSLYDVRVEETMASAAVGIFGRVLAATPLANVSAALVSVQQTCGVGDSTPLVDSAEASTSPTRPVATSMPGTMLLRSMSFDAAECTAWLSANVTLVGCADEDSLVCGTDATCEMSDIGHGTSMPSCACSGNFVAAPTAESEAVAPYTVGCAAAGPTPPDSASDGYDYSAGLTTMLLAALATFFGMGVMIWRHQQPQRAVPKMKLHDSSSLEHEQPTIQLERMSVEAKSARRSEKL